MSETLYRQLLRLYPRSFRLEYQAEMLQLFRDRMAAETSASGRLRLWLDLLGDLIVSVPREHRRRTQPAVEVSGYRLSEEGIGEMAGRTHAGQVRYNLLAVALAATACFLGHASLWPLCVVYGLLLCFAAAPLRGMRQFQEYWRGFEIFLDDDCLRQVSATGVGRTIPRADVTGLLEIGGQGLTVQSRSTEVAMWVPSTLNGYEELRTRLSAWAPLQQDSRSGASAWGASLHYLIVTTVAFYPAALLVRSTAAAIALTVAVGVNLLSLAAAARSVRRNKAIPKSEQLPVAASLIPVGAAILLGVRLFFLLG